jgi:hypothetical protein
VVNSNLISRAWLKGLRSEISNLKFEISDEASESHSEVNAAGVTESVFYTGAGQAILGAQHGSRVAEHGPRRGDATAQNPKNTQTAAKVARKKLTGVLS